MNEPNTSLKFLVELKKTKAAVELNNIIDMGTCNHHTVQGIFETGVLSSGWDIKKLKNGAHCILHDTAARIEYHFNVSHTRCGSRG